MERPSSTSAGLGLGKVLRLIPHQRRKVGVVVVEEEEEEDMDQDVD
jgi:hypothetical protein